MAADDPERASRESEIAKTREQLEGIRTGGDFIERTARDGNVNLTGIAMIDQGIVKKWRENPRLMLYKLQANSYKLAGS